MAVWELGGLGGNTYSGLRVTRRDDAHAAAENSLSSMGSGGDVGVVGGGVGGDDGGSSGGGATGRLLAANFDGFHSEGSRKAPTLTDSVRFLSSPDITSYHIASPSVSWLSSFAVLSFCLDARTKTIPCGRVIAGHRAYRGRLLEHPKCNRCRRWRDE